MHAEPKILCLVTITKTTTRSIYVVGQSRLHSSEFDRTYLYRSPPQHSPGLSALAGHQVSGRIPLNQSGVSVKVT